MIVARLCKVNEAGCAAGGAGVQDAFRPPRYRADHPVHTRLSAMRKTLLVCAAALGFGLSGPAVADDKTIGAVIGGTTGGVVGYQLGGEGGAAIGAIIGAVVGAEIADDDDRRHRHHSRYDRYDRYDHDRYDDYRGREGRYVRRGPPPHAVAWGYRPPAHVVYVDHDRRHRGDHRHWRDDRRHRHDRYCRH